MIPHLSSDSLSFRILYFFLSLLFSLPSDYPSLRMGFSRNMAMLFVFAFSAAFHEVVISTPFRYFALHAFFGMLAQAPLVTVTKAIDKRFDSPWVGNVLFWCVFCVFGQPMGVIMYYYDLYKISNK